MPYNTSKGFKTCQGFADMNYVLCIMYQVS